MAKIEPSGISLVWESIEDPLSSCGTYRAKVFGGWLIRCVEHVLTPHPNSSNGQEGYEWTSSMVFIPDALHVWGNL